MNWRRSAEDEVSKLTPAVRQLCEAYCDGVNEFGLKVPFPMKLATRGYEPEPWAVSDIILTICMTAYLTLAQSQGEMERLIIQMIQNGISREKLHELFPQIGNELDEELIRKVRLSQPLVPESIKWGPAICLMASNSWVVARTRTSNGKPLLAGDIHLEVNRLPSIWYEQILRMGSRYFCGATLPGVPSLIVGRTNDLAWTPTYAFMDCEDSWIERCRDGHYLVQEHEEIWQRIQTRDETIKRRGKEPHKQRYWYTHHGVLDCDPVDDGYYLATVWTGSRSGAQSLNSGIQMWQAKDVAEGRLLLGQVESAWNWVLADLHGNIAYQMSGLMPRRRSYISGLVPMPGWDAANDWQGMIDQSELPQCVNPSDGYFVTANNDLNRFGQAAPINLPMGAYRAERIEQLLKQNEKVTTADVQRMHYDLCSTQAARFMTILRPLLPDTRQGQILRDWDCCYDLESKGAFLFETVYEKLLLTVFGKSGLGEATRFLWEETGVFVDFYSNFDRVLLAEGSLWFDGRSRDDVYRSVLEEALSIEPRPWRARQRVMVSYLPFQGKLSMPFQLLGWNRSISLPGGRATIAQGQIYRSANRVTTFAPGYRFIADMSTDGACSNMPGGPSESPFSKWYASDLQNWMESRYKKL
jgi:penicillin amidase